jgi:hypothetical protein
LGCGESLGKKNSIELISEVNQQKYVFQNLMTVTNNTVSDNIQKDSLAFLVLPVQASCPACRNKTIDSIVKHQDNLEKNHFIIISANGGRKTISGYFQENDKKLPDMVGKLILDSTNIARKLNLYDKKPTIYYTYNRKAYKKVAAIPSTVRDDLQEFFSGFRNSMKLAKK